MGTIKVKFPCAKCKKSGWIETELGEFTKCTDCDGESFTIQTIDAEVYKSERPEREEYTCLGCAYKETILRPVENQIPTSWMNWGSILLCNKCKIKVLYAGMVAMAAKADELRDS